MRTLEYSIAQEMKGGVMGLKTRIGRRVVKTACECVVFDKKNKMRETVVELYGDYSNITRATNACSKKLGCKRVLVKSVKLDAFYASMPLEKFIAEADQISRTEKVSKEQ